MLVLKVTIQLLVLYQASQCLAAPSSLQKYGGIVASVSDSDDEPFFAHVYEDSQIWSDCSKFTLITLILILLEVAVTGQHSAKIMIHSTECTFNSMHTQLDNAAAGCSSYT